MTQRDFNTISPSAKVLLKLKAQTDIPFAKAAAQLIKDEEEMPLFSDHDRRVMFGYLLHFENRYKTIDGLLKDTTATNILELSSGFSFRGLQLCMENEKINYIDTDLPGFITVKKELLDQLKKELAITIKGTLDLQPLNALDEEQFFRLTDNFPPGPVTIVNEGLLVYLDEAEKRQLCNIIHTVLSKRGGCWITGDVYLRRPQETDNPEMEDTPFTAFLKAHNIRDKMFDSYEQAETFFNSCGFTITRKAAVDLSQLSALNILRARNIPIPDLSGAFQYRQSWKLECENVKRER